MCLTHLNQGLLLLVHLVQVVDSEQQAEVVDEDPEEVEDIMAMRTLSNNNKQAWAELCQAQNS